MRTKFTRHGPFLAKYLQRSPPSRHWVHMGTLGLFNTDIMDVQSCCKINKKKNQWTTQTQQPTTQTWQEGTRFVIPDLTDPPSRQNITFPLFFNILKAFHCNILVKSMWIAYTLQYLQTNLNPLSTNISWIKTCLLFLGVNFFHSCCNEHSGHIYAYAV